MAYQTADGKNKSSRFRQARYDRENKPDTSAPTPKSGGGTEGPRQKAHELGSGGSPSVSNDPQPAGPERANARELHMHFNDVEGTHHVHTIHDDGTEEHSDHPSREEAFAHGAMSSGVHLPDKEAHDQRAKRPSEAENVPSAEDYDVDNFDVPALSGY